MPPGGKANLCLDAQHGWERSDMVTAAEILEKLSARFTLTPGVSSIRGSAPAERWLVDGGSPRVGLIASVTRPFCRACDRTRLTADGQVRSCLFACEESDLRSALRFRRPWPSRSGVVPCGDGSRLTGHAGRGTRRLSRRRRVL
jgi:molybdenum cofactor biosynthesis enzyme MoaA